jgi:hypothetical protein
MSTLTIPAIVEKAECGIWFSETSEDGDAVSLQETVLGPFSVTADHRYTEGFVEYSVTEFADANGLRAKIQDYLENLPSYTELFLVFSDGEDDNDKITTLNAESPDELTYTTTGRKVGIVTENLSIDESVVEGQKMSAFSKEDGGSIQRTSSYILSLTPELGEMSIAVPIYDIEIEQELDDIPSYGLIMYDDHDDQVVTIESGTTTTTGYDAFLIGPLNG